MNNIFEIGLDKVIRVWYLGCMMRTRLTITNEYKSGHPDCILLVWTHHLATLHDGCLAFLGVTR